MPQYELEKVGPKQFSGLQRGRSPEEAVRLVGEVPDDVTLVVGEESGEGWHTVEVDGQPAGRVRIHQRMRFRRD